MARKAAAIGVVSLPYVALAVAVRELVAWPWAAANAAILAAALGAHAACYALWQPHRPRAILLNEFLTRAWFAVYAVIVASWVGASLAFVAGFGAAWTALTWAVHARLVRDGYRAAENALLLGLFVLGLALALATF